MASLTLHPDRLLPAEPGVRAVARRLLAEVADLPVVSPHGHVDAALLAEDRPLSNPTALLVSGDHYVTRLLHAAGADMGALGVGRAGPAPDPRAAWRVLCSHWGVLAGTATRGWLEHELVDLFGVDRRPDAGNADDLYDQVAAQLADDDHRPRALYHRMGIEVLATTDDPAADLAAHHLLAGDPSWKGRVVPTWRPDPYVEPAQPGWPVALQRLAAGTDVDTGTCRGLMGALRVSRDRFRAAGATATDHGHLDPGTEALTGADAERIFSSALVGEATPQQCSALRRHLVHHMGLMAADDGLVMAVHTGVARNHHPPTFDAFGADAGADIPVATTFTDHLAPLLAVVGDRPGFRMVLFTTDETVWSRELAPLAGFYPGVYLGAPWWFLDEPDAMARFRAAVTGTAGFSRSAGFVDDTRALCSVRARHDTARRVECGHLARLVCEHRLDEDEAATIAVDLAGASARRAFRL